MRVLLFGVLLIGCVRAVPLPDPEPVSQAEFRSSFADEGRLPGSMVKKMLLAQPTDPLNPTFSTVTSNGSITGNPLITGNVAGLASAGCLIFDGTGTCTTGSRRLIWDGVDIKIMSGASTFLACNNGTGVCTDNFGFATSAAFLSSVGSGSNGVGVTTNGARIDFGAGANDYASSDGTTVTFAGPVTVNANFTATNSSVRLQSSTFGFTGLSASTAAPTISSGFGASPSVATNNGTSAFTINVGTGGVATSGVIGLPTATNGWVCRCDDIAAAVSTSETKMSATTTASCTVTSVNSATGAAVAWASGEILHCTAVGR